MAYEVVIKPSAQRDLDAYPSKEVQRIADRISHLTIDPRPFGSQKLAGAHAYRIRSGNYRILYEVDDKRKMVLIFRIKHRREAYR
ncbi:MAG: plasmid stabilization system [Bacteroidetes bacterium]|nr:plasmid stabilization system [Bacteroidota bacterium]